MCRNHQNVWKLAEINQDLYYSLAVSKFDLESSGIFFRGFAYAHEFASYVVRRNEALAFK